MGVNGDMIEDHDYFRKPKTDYFEALHAYPQFPSGAGFASPLELKIRSTRSVEHEKQHDPHPDYRERNAATRKKLWAGFHGSVRIIRGAIAEVLRTAQTFDPKYMQRLQDQVQGQYIVSMNGPMPVLPALVAPYSGQRSN